MTYTSEWINRKSGDSHYFHELSHKQGAKNHSLHSVWRNMWSRCASKSHKDYTHYGGRGITVCERWKCFWCFVEDMGVRPVNYTLDRFPDNNGNYEPNNVRWATWKQQAANRRSTRNKM